MTAHITDIAVCKKKTTQYFLLNAAVSVAVIVFNILLTVFRTDATHLTFLILNILSDIAAVWTVYAITVLKIIPAKKLLALCKRGESGAKTVCGTVTDVSENRVSVQGFACLKITIENGDGQTELYLAGDFLTLEKGKKYKLFTVENLISAAEDGI